MEENNIILCCNNKDFEVKDGVLLSFTVCERDTETEETVPETVWYKVVVPNGVTEIGEGVFRENENIISVTLPKGLTKIGKEAFSGCKELSFLSMPDGLTEIGEKAFSGCEKISSLTLPKKLLTVGNGAFEGCQALTALTFPGKVRKVGSQVFSGCEKLEKVCFCGTKQQWKKIKGEDFNEISDKMIFYRVMIEVKNGKKTKGKKTGK